MRGVHRALWMRALPLAVRAIIMPRVQAKSSAKAPSNEQAPTSAKARVGLMGGTFDPVHLGHLFIAEEARVRCNLERVVFFPNNQPAHREGKEACADSQTRFEMTQLAVQGNPHFHVSRVELDRPGPSYAIDTLGHFGREYQGCELFFIVGADSLNDVLTWHRGPELFDLCRFIAASRPGFSLERAREKLTEPQRERVHFLETPGLHIASRDLRERVAHNFAIRYLVPDEVERAIRERGLYHAQKSPDAL